MGNLQDPVMLNVIAYIIYLFITYLITVHVGLSLHRNGRIYILTLLKGNSLLTDSINNLLLAGYYLLNLGYATLMIRQWQTVHTVAEVLSSIAVMTGRIMLLLALIHFMNMLSVYLFTIYKNKISNHIKI